MNISTNYQNSRIQPHFGMRGLQSNSLNEVAKVAHTAISESPIAEFRSLLDHSGSASKKSELDYLTHPGLSSVDLRKPKWSTPEHRNLRGSGSSSSSSSAETGSNSSFNSNVVSNPTTPGNGHLRDSSSSSGTSSAKKHEKTSGYEGLASDIVFISGMATVKAAVKVIKRCTNKAATAKVTPLNATMIRNLSRVETPRAETIRAELLKAFFTFLGLN